jgi:hypothetical protein
MTEPDFENAYQEAELDRLAKLRPFEYGKARKNAAKALAVPVAFLDLEIATRRGDQADDQAAPGQGRPIQLPEIEPWDDPVDGVQLVGGLVAQIQRFVSLGSSEALATALWIVHAHAHDAAFHSPRLAALSPTKGCGKSTLLRCIYSLTPRSLLASNVSPASVFRVIEASRPTFLIDEIDSTNEEARAELVGIINSSHCRLDAQIIRSVPVVDGYEPRTFSTWAPIVLAAIGKIPEQWADRSVIIPMQRKARSDRCERMRLDHDQGFAELGRKAARWAIDHLSALRVADPALPDELPDRQADNWRLLIAVADQAGGKWPKKAREAARLLSNVEDRHGLGEMLLSDIRDLFGDRDRMASAAIVTHLHGLDERPWAELGKARKPITVNRLARLLNVFKIHPGTIRLEDGGTQKGYKREAFVDPWNRYLSPASPSQTDTTSQPKETAAYSDFQTRHRRFRCDGLESAER